MKITGFPRSRMLLFLIASLAAAWFAPAEEGEGVTLAEHVQQSMRDRRAISSAGQGVERRLEVLRLRDRNEEAVGERALFSAASWAESGPNPVLSVAPEPALGPAPVAATIAPPLPFSWLGKYEEGGRTFVFLDQADRSWVARVGDTVADSYRVERIDGSAVTLRYLPLDEVQVLNGALPQ